MKTTVKLTIRAENADSQAVASAAGTANGEKKNSPPSPIVPPSGSPEPESIRSKGWFPPGPACIHSQTQQPVPTWEPPA